MKMLILRGKAGNYGGKEWPRGALDEPSALGYARRRGYAGEVLDIPGLAYEGSPQAKMATEMFAANDSCAALYGFSAGGYNVRHVIKALNAEQLGRLRLVVVLGAPGNPRSAYDGRWEVVYRVDPPGGHMDGPRALLAELGPESD